MVKTRSAPSPTGEPHIGTAYNALFNLAVAKKNRGKFILRIEDTDRNRLVKSSVEQIINSLHWLGISWDEGPFRQSERLPLYQKAAQQLVDNGAAYWCDCSPERLTNLRKEQMERKQVPRYDGKCRADPPKGTSKENRVVRLKVPESGETVLEDAIRGKIVFQNKDIDDSILLKSDGWPTYHLAVVVDDIDMGITHVLRAEEWLSSTPKHVLLYKAFGKQLPVFAHLPLIRNQDKSKISKRKNPVSILWYRQQGFLPEAILNYLSLMGWSMPDGREVFSLADFIENFDLGRVDPTGPIFDIKKLEWLNGEWIRSQSIEELVDRLKDFTKVEKADIKRILPLVQERMKKLSEFDGLTGYFFSDEISIKKPEIPLKKESGEILSILKNIEQSLSVLKVWDKDTIEKALESKPEELGVGKTELFQTIRYVVTGSLATPPLFDTLEAVGREKTLKRVHHALNLLGKP